MKTEILSMLRAADGYVSGQQICDRFHVSRTAVWKVIEQLKEEGYEIEAVRAGSRQNGQGGMSFIMKKQILPIHGQRPWEKKGRPTAL